LNPSLTYRHTQNGPWRWLLYLLVVVFFAVGWGVRSEWPLSIILLGAGMLMLVFAFSFQHLTVEDEGDQLAIRFGPFPLFHKRIRYDSIRDVEKGRTTVLDGWGIHWIPWRGWVWNIWGFDCVVLHLNGGTLRVGTDDPDGLVEFLRSRITIAR
jgi:hypothetical protein